MWLSNAGIGQSQRVTFLAAAAPSGLELSNNSTNDEFLSAVTYKQVAFVLKQFEQTTGNSHDSSSSVLAGSSAKTLPHSVRGRAGVQRQPSYALKRLPYHLCLQYGQWKDGHRINSSLINSVASF